MDDGRSEKIGGPEFRKSGSIEIEPGKYLQQWASRKGEFLYCFSTSVGFPNDSMRSMKQETCPSQQELSQLSLKLAKDCENWQRLSAQEQQRRRNEWERKKAEGPVSFEYPYFNLLNQEMLHKRYLQLARERSAPPVVNLNKA
jgi:hypothetical protein